MTAEAHCKIGRVLPKVRLITPDDDYRVDSLVTLGLRGSEAAWDLWRFVHEEGANAVAFVVTFPNRKAGISYALGTGGSLFETLGALESLKQRMLNENLGEVAVDG